jgi:hypothetical protein
MKKLTGILVAMVLMGILTGCYSTGCEQPAPMSVKGEG